MVPPLTEWNFWPVLVLGRSNSQTRPSGSNMGIGRFADASPRQDGHPQKFHKGSLRDHLPSESVL